MVKMDYMVRIWDQFYTEWKPLSDIVSIKLSKTGGWDVDTGTIVLPGDHRLSEAIQYSRIAPVPITWDMNGERWSGQITEAVRRRSGSEWTWTLTVSSDKKHFHRMLAKSPESLTLIDQQKKPLAEVMERCIIDGSYRTGLPVYLKTETQGPNVEIDISNDDYVAPIFADDVDSSDTYVDVTLLHTEDDWGDGNFKKISPQKTEEWFEAMVKQGWWPTSVFDNRNVRTPYPSISPELPQGWFYGKGNLDFEGKPYKGDDVDIVSWNPFEVNRIKNSRDSSKYYTSSDSRVYGATRTATVRKLTELANTEDQRLIGAFITRWAPGTFTKETLRNTIFAAAKFGKVRLADGRTVFESMVDDVFNYVGGDEWGYAWESGDSWIIADQWDFEALIRKIKAEYDKPKLRTPGILVRYYPGRDRREVVFSSSDGGGLSNWEASIKAPDGASLVMGTQNDQATANTIRDMSDGELQTFGRSRVEIDQLSMPPAAIEAAKLRGDSITVTNDPTNLVHDSRKTVNSFGMNVDLTAVGPFYYRERYMSASGGWNVQMASRMESEWSASQGGTSISLTVSEGTRYVLGDDIQLPDGRNILGWRIGDRVTFVDEGIQISDIINGWEFEDSASGGMKITPLIGKRINQVSPFDTLVDELKRAKKSLDKWATSSVKRLDETELKGIVDHSYGEKFDGWSKGIESNQNDLDKKQQQIGANQQKLVETLVSLRSVVEYLRSFSSGQARVNENIRDFVAGRHPLEWNAFGRSFDVSLPQFPNFYVPDIN